MTLGPVRVCALLRIASILKEIGNPKSQAPFGKDEFFGPRALCGWHQKSMLNSPPKQIELHCKTPLRRIALRLGNEVGAVSQPVIALTAQ